MKFPQWLGNAARYIANRSTVPDRATSTRNPPVPRRRANIVVTHENALQLATCFACIRNISEDIAKLPWNVFAKANGRRIKLDGSQLNRLLNTRPNPEMGSLEFRRTLLSWALSWHGGYAEIERDLSMRPVALWPLSPDRVDPIRVDGEVWYRIWNYGKEPTWLPPEDVLHVHGPGFDGITGYSMIGLAAQAIGFSLAAEEHGANFYGNDTQLGTIFKAAHGMDDESVTNMRNELKERKGSKNAWEGLLLEEGMDVTTIASKQVDAQYLETRRFEVEEVCRFWRVPPHKVGELTHAHFRNVEQLNISYATDCLQPWVKCLEEEADYKLISARGDKRYTRIALQGLMRGDSKARVDFYNGMHRIGVLSINEIREKEDMDPIGPEGDEHFMQSAMTTVKRIVDGTVAGQLPAPIDTDDGDADEPEETDDNNDDESESRDPRDIVNPSIRALAMRFLQRDLKRCDQIKNKLDYKFNLSNFSDWVAAHHQKELHLRQAALNDILGSVVQAYGDIDPDDILLTYELCATEQLRHFYDGKQPDIDFVCDEFLRAFEHGSED